MTSYASPPDHEPGNEARQLRIADEFRRGYSLLESLGKAVTYFGSHTATPDDYWYKEARKLAKLMAEAGFSTVTGGGPGIMEAANRGAIEAGGRSIGFTIVIKDEQKNDFVGEAVTFDHLFVRRVMLASAGYAYVFFPGGFGSLDEFFEISTLIHIHKLHEDIPVILVGTEFWNPLFDWLKNVAVDQFHAFDGEDLAMWLVAKDAEEAYELLSKSVLPIRLYY